MLKHNGDNKAESVIGCALISYLIGSVLLGAGLVIAVIYALLKWGASL